jgi:DNA-binding NarL/FixJ family response regulator
MRENELRPDKQHRKTPRTAVVILGSSVQCYQALAYVLEREVCQSCSIVRESCELPQVLRRGDQRKVLLIDFMDGDYEKTLVELAVAEDWASLGVVFALFNCKHDPGIERRAFRRGVRGFFYREDQLDLLLKGIFALFRGEIWVSRDLLMDLATGKTAAGIRFDGESETLTQREIQVLALVSVGSNNSEIAEKLFISRHTVKTHMYNVFKKLRVPNRLQAALWAEKNL